MVVAVRLDHGRVSRNMDAADADKTVVLGPYDYVQTTYGGTVRMESETKMHELSTDKHGFVFYDGRYFSDIVVFPVSKKALRKLPEFRKFDEALTVAPLTDVDTEVIEIIKSGRFINAIKYHRDKTGAGLKESKEHCETLRTEVLAGMHGEFNREFYAYLSH